MPPDDGMCRHDDPGHGTLHARLPRALGAHDLPVFQLLRVLAEIPDIPPGVLGVPVEGLLLQLTVHEHPVEHDSRADTQDVFPVFGHEGDVVLVLPVFLPLVDEPGARDQGEEAVVYPPHEAVGIELGANSDSVSPAAALSEAERSEGGSDGSTGCGSQLAIRGAATSRTLKGNRGMLPPGKMRNL